MSNLIRVLHLQDTDFSQIGGAGRFGLRSAVRMTDVALLPSRTSFGLLRTEGIDTRKNFFYCPPGTASDFRELDRSKLRESLGLKESDLLIGTKAAFEATQAADQMTVCRSIPKIFESRKKARFVFAGPVIEGGEDTFNECVEFCDDEGIGDRVFFLTERDEIDASVPAVDIFVYSGSGENVPVSIAEAMIRGIPAVVSDTESLAEMTDGGKAADIFVRGDENELANKVLSLIKNKNLRKKRSRDAAQFAQANFSIDAHLMSLKALYSELLPAVQESDEKIDRAIQ